MKSSAKSIGGKNNRGAELLIVAPPLAGASKRKRVMMVDDHPLTRAGLAQLIGKQEDLCLCCEAAGRNDALKYLEHNAPDLVIMDLSIPGGGGLELIKDLLTLYPRLSILVLSMHDENLYAARALRAGARGYVMKEAGAELVLQAIRTVLGGGVYLSRGMTARIVESVSHMPLRRSASSLEQLTDRELEIFRCIGEGRGTKEIATRLNLSPKTVDVHRANIRTKLDLRDTTALFRYAVCWVESLQGQRPG
jgi:DNA-binding NarL/FixJ family response regulator